MRNTTLLVVIILHLCSPIHARPPYKQALIDLFGENLPAKARDCRTCHLPEKPGEEGDRPHNLFGSVLKDLRSKHRKAGLKTDITTRILAVLDADSDGDGVSNGLELVAGTSPGSRDDRPGTAAIADAKVKLAGWKIARERHYAWQPFEPVVRPRVPTSTFADQRNPIDAFLAVEREARQLTTRPEASRVVLLRRVYLDLIGLPPSRAEIQAFEADTSPDAYERVVDRLLNSPHHGERWGRHWMDIWRYADWAGYGAEVRDSQKHIWHWRDWIIESLNRDKSYAGMVNSMLAADELTPTNADELRATGFLVRNWYLFNRNVWLDRIVEHTGKAFLGVTFNCARCHDHFYDPFTSQEYYALRAVFEPHQIRTDRLPTVSDVNVDGLVRVYDAQLTAPTYLFERGDEARPDKRKVIPPGAPSSLGGKLDIKPVSLPQSAYQPDRKAFIVKQLLTDAHKAIETADRNITLAHRLAVASFVPVSLRNGFDAFAYAVVARRAELHLAVAKLEHELAQLREKEIRAVLKVEELEAAAGVSSPEGRGAVKQAALLQQQVALLNAKFRLASAQLANFIAATKARAATAKQLKAAQTQLVAAEKLAKSPPKYVPRKMTTYPATSTGRRSALARWITDQQNPLTARVAVNHIWLRHFGRALVPTEFDFGRNGQPPSHPALLDWLAAEFMHSGWSMKHLHRLIVTSAAYRMDSQADAGMLQRDPNNRYLWRMNPRRMEGEIIRDSVLALAGRLDTTMSGPDLDHRQGLTTPRRSVYFRHAAEKQMEFLLLFDAASVNECYRRSESIIPQQALALSNSTLTQGMSRLIASQLRVEVNADDAFIRVAFDHILGRKATEKEVGVCRQFLADQTRVLSDPKKLTAFETGVGSTIPPSREPAQRARENLIHAIFNLNEFVTIR